jgi:sugar lactone lactonase YvrE
VAVAGAIVFAVLMTSVPAEAQPADASFRPAAGSGSGGFAGDGGPATDAQLKNPEGAAVTADGTLYIADTGNHRVRAVGPGRTIRTVAGDGEARNERGPLPAAAKGTEISLGYPSDLALGADGTLFIADMTGVRVYALASDGTVSVRADTTMGRDSIGTPMKGPTAIAVSPDGTLYVADQDNDRVLAFTSDGKVSEAVAEGITAPSGLAVDGQGDLWISGANALHRLRGGELSEVTSAGTVSAVSAGAGGVFTVDQAERVVRVLETGAEVRTVTELDPQTFGTSAVLLGAGTAPDGSIYLIDVLGNRVYAHEVPGSGEAGDKSVSRTWLMVLGGVALVAIAGAVIWHLRRRRPTTTE